MEFIRHKLITSENLWYLEAVPQRVHGQPVLVARCDACGMRITNTVVVMKVVVHRIISPRFAFSLSSDEAPKVSTAYM